MEDRQLRRFLEQRVVTIDEVDMSQRFVSAIDQYGTHLQISMHMNDGGITSAPAPGEVWSVQRTGNDWFLAKRADDGSENIRLKDLQPGDRRIETSGTFYVNGTPIGSSTVLSNATVGEPGILNQIRAGRVLTAADFTTLLGLSAPVGVWNLTDLTDVSGSNRTLTNKGTVTFGKGITGIIPEAAIFSGSTAQALYRTDTGAGDSLRISYGSWGCWFRTAKTGVYQTLVSKDDISTARCWFIRINSVNTLEAAVYKTDGTTLNLVLAGGSTVTDDRWHFVSTTYDGQTLSIYLDGVLETSGLVVTSGPIATLAAPFNIGATAATGAINATNPHFGRIDEAFVTTDVLTIDQIRMLYAQKIAHGSSFTPRSANITVNRFLKGNKLLSSNFPATPRRIYSHLSSYLDTGLDNATLTQSTPLGTTPGLSGKANEAVVFLATGYLYSTDTGLPSGTTARSMGAWFKTISNAGTIVSYGTNNTAEFDLRIPPTGIIMLEEAGNAITSTRIFNDGQWHFAIGVLDNSALDGLKLKLFVDGKLQATGTTITGTTLSGATGFRIGVRNDGILFFNGQIAGVFVTDYALTADDIANLYTIGSLSLGVSPKNIGDHIERIDNTYVYLITDTLESQYQIDLTVST